MRGQGRGALPQWEGERAGGPKKERAEGPREKEGQQQEAAA